MSTFIRTRRVSVTRYNPETLTLQAGIIANGGTISASSLLAADAFVTACKNSGVWAKLIDCGLFIGDQLAAALVKLVYPNGGQATLTNHNFVAGDYHEQGANGGLRGDGVTKYLSLGTTGNVANLGGIAFYARTAFAADLTLVGAGADAGSLISISYLSAAQSVLVNWAGQGIGAGPANTTGLFTGVNNANASMLFQNAAEIQGARPGLGGWNVPEAFYLFAANAGNAPTQFYSGLGSFYAVTQLLQPADVANLYAAVQTLQIALNRNV